MAVQKMAVHQSSPLIPCMQSSECILQCAMDSLFTVLFKTWWFCDYENRSSLYATLYYSIRICL